MHCVVCFKVKPPKKFKLKLSWNEAYKRRGLHPTEMRINRL